MPAAPRATCTRLVADRVPARTLPRHASNLRGGTAGRKEIFFRALSDRLSVRATWAWGAERSIQTRVAMNRMPQLREIAAVVREPRRHAPHRLGRVKLTDQLCGWVEPRRGRRTGAARISARTRARVVLRAGARGRRARCAVPLELHALIGEVRRAVFVFEVFAVRARVGIRRDLHVASLEAIRDANLGCGARRTRATRRAPGVKRGGASAAIHTGQRVTPDRAAGARFDQFTTCHVLWTFTR
jgi:hypothetical protein